MQHTEPDQSFRENNSIPHIYAPYKLIVIEMYTIELIDVINSISIQLK